MCGRETRIRRWTVDLEVPDWGVPRVLNAVNGGPSVAPVFATRHCSLGIASRARQPPRHRSRLGRVCHRRRTSRTQKMRPGDRRALVGHKILLDDDAEGVRTFLASSAECTVTSRMTRILQHAKERRFRLEGQRAREASEVPQRLAWRHRDFLGVHQTRSFLDAYAFVLVVSTSSTASGRSMFSCAEDGPVMRDSPGC